MGFNLNSDQSGRLFVTILWNNDLPSGKPDFTKILAYSLHRLQQCDTLFASKSNFDETNDLIGIFAPNFSQCRTSGPSCHQATIFCSLTQMLMLTHSAYGVSSWNCF